MRPIAEVAFDVANSENKMLARVFAPEHDPSTGDWSCTFEIDDPIAVCVATYGISSLQALVLGLKTMATYLYGSDEYKNKQFGLYGKLGGDLSLPAPAILLDSAPYPF